LNLIDDNGTFLSDVDRDQALFLAYEKGTDLVEISPKATPPVAKLVDIGKYLYEQQKKQAKQKSNQKGGELKEIRLSLKIEDHDLATKARMSKNFLDQGDKVRVTVILRGRENIFPERASDIINRFATISAAKIESRPSRLGNRISSILVKSNG
jgi:translation initiation factor IF-3